jgi:hypothetical protein
MLTHPVTMLETYSAYSLLLAAVARFQLQQDLKLSSHPATFLLVTFSY